MMYRQISRGFTLIELLVAIAIAAILAAVAIPAYSNYVLKSHRTEAKAMLLDLASLEERYASTNGGLYTTDPTQLAYPAGTTFPVTTVSGYYSIAAPTVVAATSTTPATYSFTATPVGRQVNDTACPSFTLNSAGVQGPAATAATCWR
jgi:type IV pilus assembly protein PilE